MASKTSGARLAIWMPPRQRDKVFSYQMQYDGPGGRVRLGPERIGVPGPGSGFRWSQWAAFGDFSLMLGADYPLIHELHTWEALFELCRSFRFFVTYNVVSLDPDTVTFRSAGIPLAEAVRGPNQDI
jgi:hypothetical protein